MKILIMTKTMPSEDLHMVTDHNFHDRDENETIDEFHRRLSISILGAASLAKLYYNKPAGVIVTPSVHSQLQKLLDIHTDILFVDFEEFTEEIHDYDKNPTLVTA